MAKDRVREEADKSSINKITSLAKAALTVGVGAAVFYRGGGRKLLSEGVDISTRFLSGTAGSIKSGNLKSKGIASFISGERKNWSEIATRVKERSKDYERAMPEMSSKNVLGYVQNIFNLRGKGGENHLTDMFNEKNVTPQIRSTINKIVSSSSAGKIEDLSPRLKRGIEELTSDLPKTLDNHDQMQELLKKSGLDKHIGMKELEDAGAEIKKILDNSYEAKRDFIEKNQYGSGGIIDQMMQKLLDPESIRKKFGSVDDGSLIDKILGDKGLNVGRYLDSTPGLEEVNIQYLKKDGSFTQGNFKDMLEDVADKIGKKGSEARNIFDSIQIDKFNLRVKDDEIYSFQKSMNIFDKANVEFGETVAGKILKTTSLRERTFAPIYQVMHTGHHDVMISAMMSDAKERSFKIKDDMIRVFDKVYKVSDGNLEHIKELDNMSLAPSRYSSISRMVNKMMGNANYKESDNVMKRYFDVGQTPGYTLFNKIGDILGVTERSADHRIKKNLVKDLQNAGEKLAATDSIGHNKNLERMNEITMFYRKYTGQLKGDTAKALADSSKSDKGKSLFSLISEQDDTKFMAKLNEDLMENRLVPEGMANLDASSILKKYIKDPIAARRIAPLRGDLSDFFGGKRSSNLAETIRVELGKEAFIQEALSSSKSQDRILELIEEARISGRDKTATKMMAQWGALQSMTGMFNASGRGKTEKEIAQISGKIQDIFGSKKETEFLKTLKEDLFRSMKEKPGFRRGEVRSGLYREELEKIDGLSMQDQSPEWVHMNKGIGIISAINDRTKTKGFFKQFIAGRDDPENVTSFTFPPYFYVHRVIEALSTIGLNFSSASTANVLDYSKNVALKRILPVAITYTYLDYLSDTVGRVTGTTLQGYAASGLANVDLGARKILDTVGIGKMIETERELNPIAHYYLGNYQDSDERREWYQSGYSPMRKSRWWNFGSLSEWRGSEISYFQPNYLRRAHSNWDDAALYDSLGEKWSRSWLPTPTSPLSPLRYLMNPYWLEEKHKEDRPYMMTGKMFAEETPWGAVLNPTLGQIIKPQKRMHEDRLDKNYVDVRWLIEQRNMDQMYKAQNKNEQHMVRIRDGIIENVLYTPLDSPTPSQRIISIGSDEDGNVNINSPTGYQQFSGVGPAREIIDGREEIGDSTIGSGLPSTGLIGGLTYERPAVGISFTDRLNIGTQAGDLKDEILASLFSPTYDIGVINRTTYEKAAARNNRPIEKGIVTTESINISQARYGSHILKNKEAVADLKGLSSGDDLIGELAYMGRYMTGLHGYAAYRAFSGKPRTKVEDASNMNSSVRRFWDTNVGGLGGSEFEIMRRFLPFQNRMAQRFNPLMNTASDWLPERFRFGDPYCVSKDTLIEVGKLGFIKAEDVKIGECITTHKGNHKEVDDLSIRRIKENEKVYSLKVTSLTATEMKFSEEHPILIIENPSQRRQYKDNIKSIIHRQANSMIELMEKGINDKKTLASLSGTTTNDSWRIFKMMYKDNIIYDYKENKMSIIPKNLKKYEIDMIEKGIKWRQVKDIKEGDYVVYPKPRFENKKIILDLKDYLDYPHTEKYLYVLGTLKKESTMHLAYEWLEKNGIPEFKYGERKLFLLQEGFGDKDYENAQAFKRKNIAPERIDRFLEINSEIAFLFGLYIGEGSINDSHISLSLHMKEEEMFEKAAKGATYIHPGINYSFRKKEGTNGAEGYIFSKPISKLINSLFGKYSHHKKLPEFFADMDKDTLSYFLRGYFDGDGSSFNEKIENKLSNNKVYIVNLSSVNLKLMLQVRKLLMKYEIIGNLQKGGDSKKSYINGKEINSGKSYKLIIRGVNAVKLGKILGYENMEYQGNRSSTHTFFLDEYVCMRVIKNEIVNDVDKVWGFEVGQDDSFCISGVATHNTKLPKGEMRLPGRGYENINDLHPDEYGQYGAFDRMKILADVSPFSHEYKVWRDIAQQTVKDQGLKDEMQDIRRRVTEQAKKYDFYGYRFLGRGVDKKSVTIEEVMNNNYFTVVGNNEVYRMAGIEVKSGEDQEEGVLDQFVKPGMNVTMAVDENEYRGRNTDQYNSINAAILIDGQNLNKQLIDQKLADMRENDLSAAAHMAKFNDFQIARGKFWEALSHAPIPFFQQKFFKIRDPLESYKHEQVYGTSYSSWTSPIKSFLYPSIERSLMSAGEIGIGMAAYGIYSHIDQLEVGSKTKTASKLAMLLTNRGAGIGALVGKIAKFDYGSTAKSMAKFGAMAQVAGYAYTRQDNLIEAPIGFGAVGAYLGTHLIEESGGKKGALIGAAVGLAVAASKGSLIDDDGLFSKWIPKRTKDKWEMQEYFDRLDYIKYSGLYEKAATKAMRKEDTNIRGFVNQFEKDKEEKNRIRQELEEYREITEKFYAEGDTRAEAIIGSIDNQLKSIQDSQINMTVGKYGRAALIYKQAMDSTIYGLKEGASWAQLLRATPKNERDHFMEFAKEQDPEKREEILKYTSPYMKRAYQIAWGEKPDRQESMGSFFDGHYLPAPTWSGWRPGTDLEDVQIKTIQNEGQLLSDYGFYESQLRDPDVIDAPNLRPDRGQSGAIMQTSLLSNLHGLGLTGVDVSINKTDVSGFQVISNIKRITEYNVEQGFKKMLSFL